jgi:hypothetical protein
MWDGDGKRGGQTPTESVSCLIIHERIADGFNQKQWTVEFGRRVFPERSKSFLIVQFIGTNFLLITYCFVVDSFI